MYLKRMSRTLLLIGSLLGSALVVGQDSTTQTAPAPADNTKVNQRDQNANEPTADQQKNNRSDRDITQKIRQAIVKDKSLSTYAHNVKIINQIGLVNLKDTVRSGDEKNSMEAKTAEIAGGERVTSELDVKSKN